MLRKSACGARTDAHCLRRIALVFVTGLAVACAAPVAVGSNWLIDKADEIYNVPKYVSIALSSADHPHISYYDWGSVNGQRDLRYAFWDGSDWQTEIVESEADTGKYTSISVDSGGNPHIAYVDASSGLIEYAVRGPGGWTIEPIGTGSEAPLSLALDGGGVPHVAYSNGGAATYATKIGGLWVSEPIAGLTSCWNFSLALDSAGLLVSPSNAPHTSCMLPRPRGLGSRSTWGPNSGASPGAR